MKRNGGQTVHTTAEFVRMSEPRNSDSCQVVRVTWEGISHERLLYEIPKTPLFHFPKPHDAPPPAPDDALQHLLARRRYLADHEQGVEGTNGIGPYPGKSWNTGNWIVSKQATPKRQRKARKGKP